MKKIIIIFSLSLIFVFSLADTHIPAGNVNGVWTIANSPYIIDGEISIQQGDELTIEPGIQVIFSGHYKFNIYGRILAEGTASDTIIFTAQDTTVGWHSLRFYDTNINGQDSSKVVYCKLEYGKATGNYLDRFGGSICCSNSSDILIKNCLITKNTADAGGGGIFCKYSSSPSLTDVTISENSTYCDGGGIGCENSSPSLTNVIIKGNTADWGGGGIFSSWYSNLSLENVTITGNNATMGGGIWFCEYSNPTFNSEDRCNIFLNFAGSGNDLYVYHCSIIDVIVDTFTVLQPDYNFAYPINNFTFDILNAKVEQVNQDLYVSPTGSDDNSGLTPEDPLQLISWALTKIIADSTNLHTIYLTNGTYSPSQTGEIFPLNCRSYVSLQGEDENSTILDGEELRDILYCKYDNNFTIQDMIIQNGNAYYGGGIYCSNSSPSLENVTLSGNTANECGGGIYCSYNSSPSLKNVKVNDNTALISGAGILCRYNSNPSLTNVTIYGNTASSGGGIYCEESNPILVNCILWNDTPQEIYIVSASVTATYSDIQGGWSGEGNINADPLFADPQNGDFHLTWANFPIPDSTMSPCIDAGDPNSPLDPDSTIADMGAFYFDQNQQEVDDISILKPSSILYQNYPNPFNPAVAGAGRSLTTNISFSLNTENTESTEIIIYNIKGQKIKTLECINHVNAKATESLYHITWNGTDENNHPVSSGVYLYQLKVDGKQIDTKRCLLLK